MQILSDIEKHLNVVKKPKKCPYCRGTGWEDRWERHDEVYGPNSTPVLFAVPCRICKGKVADAPRYNIRLPYDAYLNAFDISRYKDANGNAINFTEQLKTIQGYIRNYQKVQKASKIKGLYFAGEMIDVDALTGGFNLQIAWSTGYLAGTSCKED